MAVITGGARGIGLAIAEWFLANGHRVALWDIDATTLAATAARLESPQRVLAVPCDVSSPQQVQAAVDAVAVDGYGLVGGIGEYEGSVRMAYVRGPEGIVVSLFEQIG